jgi:hypothetical protein
VLFVDFKQVFDWVKRIKIYEILRQRDMPANLVILIKMTMEHADGRIIFKSNLSEKFSTFRGVRHGVTLIIKKRMSREQ